MEINFEELLEAICGQIVLDNKYRNFTKLCTDTRKIGKDNIFLALNGENFNGNKYVKEAFEKGASIAIVDEDINIEQLKELGVVIKVSNTFDSLLNLAKYYRNKLGLKVVGVTGSTGKTSTKDLVAAFLSEKYKVFKTKGNFNNHIGLPLMILELDSSYDVAVLELGMSNLGEIHTLADCARPDIALITNIGLSHIENLKTKDNILKAKMEITDYFNKNNILIVNGEDDYLSKLSQKNYKVIKTGYSIDFDILAKSIELTDTTTSFVLQDGTKEVKFTLPMVGVHNVLNALLGIAAAKELNVSYDEMVEGLNNIEATSMRLEFIDCNDFKVINDCYNASPSSMKAALDVLKNYTGNRKVAILGTMNELGDEAPKAHEGVGEYAKNKADILIVVGEYSDNYKKGYGNDVIIYNNKEQLISNLKDVITLGDIILVKASRGKKFEEIVKMLQDMKI